MSFHKKKSYRKKGHGIKKYHSSSHYNNEYIMKEESVSSSPNFDNYSNHSHPSQYTHRNHHKRISYEPAPYFRNHQIIGHHQHSQTLMNTDETHGHIVDEKRLSLRVDAIDFKMKHLKKSLQKSERNYSNKIDQLSDALTKLKIQNKAFEKEMMRYHVQIRGFEVFVSSLNLNTRTPHSHNNSHTTSNSTEFNVNNEFYDPPSHPNLYPHNTYISSSFIRSTPSSLDNHYNINPNHNINNNIGNKRQSHKLFQKDSPKHLNNNNINHNNINNNNINNNNINNINDNISHKNNNNNNYMNVKYNNNSENSESNSINDMSVIDIQSQSNKSSTIPPGTNILDIKNNKTKKFKLKVNTSLNDKVNANINHHNKHYNNTNNNNHYYVIKPTYYANGTPTSTASRLSRSYSPNNRNDNIVPIVFDKKPFGFQVLCDQGKIRVQNVTKHGQAYNVGIKKNWIIIQVNGVTRKSKMVKQLRSNNGQYKIIFRKY